MRIIDLMGVCSPNMRARKIKPISSLIIFLGIFIAVVCCDKLQDDKYIGSGYSLKNNQGWNTSVRVNTDNKDTGFVDIILFITDNDNIARERLIFFNIPLKVGVFQLDTMSGSLTRTNTGTSYSTIVDDGDVIGDVFYSPMRNNDNFLTINSYNLSSNTIEGIFNVFLVMEPENIPFKLDQSLPDTMQFNKGSFEVKVKL